MWTAEAPSFVTPDPEVWGTAGNTCFIRIKGCLCCLLINYFLFSRFFLLFTPRICSHSTLFCKEDDQERDIQANDDDDSEKNSLGCSECLTEHFTIPLVDHKHKTSCRNTFWQVTQHFMSPTLAYSAQTASEAAPGNSTAHMLVRCCRSTATREGMEGMEEGGMKCDSCWFCTEVPLLRPRWSCLSSAPHRPLCKAVRLVPTNKNTLLSLVSDCTGVCVSSSFFGGGLECSHKRQMSPFFFFLIVQFLSKVWGSGEKLASNWVECQFLKRAVVKSVRRWAAEVFQKRNSGVCVMPSGMFLCRNVFLMRRVEAGGGSLRNMGVLLRE